MLVSHDVGPVLGDPSLISDFGIGEFAEKESPPCGFLHVCARRPDQIWVACGSLT